MADFAGVFHAPVLQVAPCGLLSVASVDEYNGDQTSERWVRGFSTMTNASPTVRILSRDNDVVTNGELFDGTGEPAFYSAVPFFIEVESKNTAKNLISNNPMDYIGEQIKAATQKAAEYELWEGVAARALATPATGYLIQQTNGAVAVTSGGVAPDKALYLLEQSISLSPTGGRGIIHMTRDVASALGTKLIYEANSRDDEQAYATTRLGTLVVIGSGYTGNGPIGATGRAASGTNKWMFATGGVEVLTGKIDIVNDSLAQGFTPATNDSIVTVLRPAAVHFDPSIWFTAQVTLS